MRYEQVIRFRFDIAPFSFFSLDIAIVMETYSSLATK